MSAVTAEFTLSQALTWDSDQLAVAATQWTTAATVWEDAFTQVNSQMSLPGGLPWQGWAAEAAQHRAYTDRLTVLGLADQLHNASAVARTGALQLQESVRRVAAAVGSAEESGFTVGQDFSVKCRHSGSGAVASQAQAQIHAAAIRARLAELIAVDRRVAAEIATATAELGAVQFVEDPPVPFDDGRIQAVDYRTVAEAPPQPPPPDPSPGPLPSVTGADDVRRILEPLPNGGKRGPNGVGTNAEVKEVWDVGSIKQLWDYLTRNADPTEGPPRYEGPVRILPDGTEIGLRKSGKGWNDTIDVWYPDGADDKVHTPYAPYFPPLISVPPQLPPMADPALVPISPPQVGHAPVALPPTGIFDPTGLPPWLQDPSSPGFHVAAQPPTVMPGVALPDLPSAPERAPDGSSLLPDLGTDLVDAGKTAGAGVLAGVAVIGGLIAAGVTPSGQIAR